MTLFNLVVVLAIAGLLLWAVGQLPIDVTIQKIIRVVVVVVVCLWLVNAVFGLGSGLGMIRIGPTHH